MNEMDNEVVSFEASAPHTGGGSPVPFASGSGEFRLEFIPCGDTFKVLAPGLARSLGFESAKDMLRSLPETEKGWEIAPTLGGDQRVGCVTEPGFYRAIGQRQAARVTDSNVRAQVERFQSWVYGEVLPAIRRTGGYGQSGGLDLSDPLAELARAGEQLTRAVSLALAERRRADSAERRAAELEPLAEGYRHFLETDGTVKWANACDHLGVAPNLFGAFLRERKVLYTDEYFVTRGGREVKRFGERHNRPYHDYRAWFAFPRYEESAELARVPEHRQHDRRVTKAGMDGLLRLLKRHVVECGRCSLCASLGKCKPTVFAAWRPRPLIGGVA
jgi:prophage antirepressor-like protein